MASLLFFVKNLPRGLAGGAIFRVKRGNFYILHQPATEKQR